MSATRALFVLTFLLLAWAGTTRAEEEKRGRDLPEQMAAAVKAFEAKVDGIKKKAEEEISKETTGVLAKLKQAFETASKSGKLEDQLAIKAKVDEIQAGVQAAAASAKPKEGVQAGTPREDIVHRGSRFTLIPENATWIEAQKKCRKMGGSLACIRNFTENEAVFKLMKDHGISRAWIGLASVKQGKWTWVNAMPMTYTWFVTRESEAMCNGHRVAAMTGTDGRWQDCDTEDMLPYICQQPAAK